MKTMRTPASVDRGRRTFLKGVAATAALAGPLIVTDRTIAQSRTIYVNTWGGSWTAAEEAAFFKPFTAQTGIAGSSVERSREACGGRAHPVAPETSTL